MILVLILARLWVRRMPPTASDRRRGAPIDHGDATTDAPPRRWFGADGAQPGPDRRGRGLRPPHRRHRAPAGRAPGACGDTRGTRRAAAGRRQRRPVAGAAGGRLRAGAVRGSSAVGRRGGTRRRALAEAQAQPRRRWQGAGALGGSPAGRVRSAAVSFAGHATSTPRSRAVLALVVAGCSAGHASAGRRAPAPSRPPSRQPSRRVRASPPAHEIACDSAATTAPTTSTRSWA